MYTLGPEEKATLVMAYTHNGLIRGEVITPASVRLNAWLRTDIAPDYLHFHNLHWLQSSEAGVHSAAYPALLLPAALVIGFHPAPPSQEPLDYDPREDNRVSRPVTILMGLFVVNGHYRASVQMDLAATLQISHSPWFSIYDASIHSPHLPQMPPIHAPMLLVRLAQVGFVPQK